MIYTNIFQVLEGLDFGFKVFLDDILVGTVTKDGSKEYTVKVDKVGSVVTLKKEAKSTALSLIEVRVMGKRGKILAR